jgi:hypothetical protein
MKYCETFSHNISGKKEVWSENLPVLNLIIIAGLPFLEAGLIQSKIIVCALPSPHRRTRSTGT